MSRTPPRARLTLEEILLPGAYAHRLRLARGDPEAFFGPWHPDRALLDQRARVMNQAPNRTVLALPEAADAIAELLDCAAHWGVPAVPKAMPLLRHAGCHLEPDLVLLQPSPAGPRMIAGVVCFPSSWRPEERLGQPLRLIHDIVPGLNETLGDAIDGFLARLQPGAAWLRANWGLSASPDLDQHPARRLPRLAPPIGPAGVWLRVEHQALTRLPRSGAILFGIRLEVLPFNALRDHPACAEALAEALASMPDAMAAYKGLLAARDGILALLPTPGRRLPPHQK